MENTNMGSEKLLQLEKYVRKSIKMTLKDVVPWSTLVILLNDMAASLAECRLLIKILVKELQIMHEQKQIRNMSGTVEKEETGNIDTNAIKDFSACNIPDNQKADNDEEIQEISNEMRPEEDINEIKYKVENSLDNTVVNEDCSEVEDLKAQNEEENEEMHFTEAYDLKDFYTFVGSNKDKVKVT